MTASRVVVSTIVVIVNSLTALTVVKRGAVVVVVPVTPLMVT